MITTALRLVSVVLTSVFALGIAAEEASRLRPTDAPLHAAIRQVKEGDLEAGLLALDAVVRRPDLDLQDPATATENWAKSGKLTAAGQAKARILSQAHLYRGVALMGLAREGPAKAAFIEALKYDPTLRLQEVGQPSRVTEVFEAARTEKAKPGLSPPSNVPKKASLGAWRIGAIVGGAALLGGGAAVAASGETASTTTTAAPTAPAPTPMPSPTPRPDFALAYCTGDQNTVSIEYQRVTPPAGGTVTCPDSSCTGLITVYYAVTHNFSFGDPASYYVWVRTRPTVNAQTRRFLFSQYLDRFAWPASTRFIAFYATLDRSGDLPTPITTDDLMISARADLYRRLPYPRASEHVATANIECTYSGGWTFTPR